MGANSRYNGHLIKSNVADRIYFVIDEVALPIENVASFNMVFVSKAWSNLIVLKQIDIDAFPKGETINNPKLCSSTMIFLVPNYDSPTSKKYWIVNEKTFYNCYFNLELVVQDDVKMRDRGPNITLGSNDREYITDLEIILANQTPPLGYTKVPTNIGVACEAYLYYKKGTGGSRITALDVDTYFFDPYKPDWDYVPFPMECQNTSMIYYKKGGACENQGVKNIILAGENEPLSSGYIKIKTDLYKWLINVGLRLCYEHDIEPSFPLTAEWMGKLNDNTKIQNISIPQAHNSAMWYDNMTSPLGPVIDHCAWCQHYDIGKQFELGVRAFDLRLYWDSSKKVVGMAHGTAPIITAYSKVNLKDVFSVLVSKLISYPSEFIILDISVEASISGTTDVKGYCDYVNDILRDYADYIYVDGNSPGYVVDRSKPENLPKLKDLRKKIYIASTTEGCHNGSLQGGAEIDPWRNRYVNGSKITLNPKDCMKNTFHDLGGGLKGDMTKFGDRINQINDIEESKRVLHVLSISVPFAFTEDTPIKGAKRVNPSAIDYLKRHNKLNRIGIIRADFYGENNTLAWEIIKINPDIRKLNLE